MLNYYTSGFINLSSIKRHSFTLEFDDPENGPFEVPPVLTKTYDEK